MAVADFEAWQCELLSCGCIVQDEDTSVPVEEAERRFNRYIELVDAVQGTEGERAARALIRSIQAVHDYGGYQATLGKLMFAFPPQEVALAVVAEVPRLISTLPDWAGDILSTLTQAQGRSAELVDAFNSSLDLAPPEQRASIVAFIRAQEAEGWLEHRRGVLAPEAA
jgi:hypothetical protein